jgi:hypothetical protein
MPHDTQTRLLEDRVVATLGARGLIRRDRPRWRDGMIAVAGAAIGASAILALQAAGPARPASPSEATHILALYTTPMYRPEPSVGGARAEEYGRWAMAHREGRAVVLGGEELGSESRRFGPPLSAQEGLAGYFLIDAPSPADAEALARSNPHLRHGGTVVLHELVE